MILLPFQGLAKRLNVSAHRFGSGQAAQHDHFSLKEFLKLLRASVRASIEMKLTPKEANRSVLACS